MVRGLGVQKLDWHSGNGEGRRAIGYRIPLFIL